MEIDFDEIASKGKSMFMISALGMAVSLNYSDKAQANQNNNTSNFIESEELEKELMKLHIHMTLSSNNLPDSEPWMYLLNNPFNDVSTSSLDKYLEVYHLGKDSQSEKQESVSNYFLSVTKFG